MLLEYFKKSFARKKARRKYQVYSHDIKTYQLETEGEIQFAHYLNPLVNPILPDQEIVTFFKKFVNPGSLCIDIGAYIGDTTVLMALAAGNEGLTLGFEPNPNTYRVLEVNASLNQDKSNIRTYPYAITESKGEFYYSSSEASMSNGGLSEELDSSHGEFQLDQKVTGINLEEFLNENYKDWISKLSLIKVDVEGHDKEILRSISPLLEKYKPNIIAECFGELDEEGRHELFDILDTKGYEMYYFEDFGMEDSIVRLARKDMMKWRHFDFYAVSK